MSIVGLTRLALFVEVDALVTRTGHRAPAAMRLPQDVQFVRLRSTIVKTAPATGRVKRLRNASSGRREYWGLRSVLGHAQGSTVRGHGWLGFAYTRTVERQRRLAVRERSMPLR